MPIATLSLFYRCLSLVYRCFVVDRMISNNIYSAIYSANLSILFFIFIEIIFIEYFYPVNRRPNRKAG